MRFSKFLPFALALCLAAAACSSGKSKPHTAPGATGTSAIRLALVAPADVVSPARATYRLDEASAKAGLAVVQQLYEATLRDPLQRGRAGSIDAIFTADAVRQAATVDRGAMYDEGVPTVARLEAKQSAVALTGFADDADHLAVLVAKFSLDVAGDGGRVHIVRRGELTMTPAFGRWFVSAYDVVNTKTVNGATTTTTAVKT